MLIGTDIDEAYEMSPQKATPATQQMARSPMQTKNALVSAPMNVKQPPPQGPVYDANSYNQQYESEKQIAAKQAYLQQQYRIAQAQQQAQQQAAASSRSHRQEGFTNDQGGYIESLGSKKKDMLKLIIMSVMILLALSIHSFVMFWMKEFIASSDFSFRQEIGTRILYPIIVLFLLWNLKTIK